jgi:hypothetical protein
MTNVLAKLYRAIIIRPIFAHQKWRCDRAKQYLLRHDRNYRSQYAGIEIVKRRDKLYSTGMSPIDPSLPDRYTLEDAMPPMAWPNSSN